MKGVLATDNKGKIEELRSWFPEMEWYAQSEFNITTPPETGLSFIENAIIKARYAAKISSLPALADDSGIVIDALDGKPGINSARYAGDHDFEKNIDKVLSEMLNVPINDRTARFCCVLAYVRKFDDPCPLVATGIWNGIILFERLGTNGFGYDPIFYDTSLKLSAAEISKDQKNQISHRAKAIEKLTKDLYV